MTHAGRLTRGGPRQPSELIYLGVKKRWCVRQKTSSTSSELYELCPFVFGGRATNVYGTDNNKTGLQMAWYWKASYVGDEESNSPRVLYINLISEEKAAEQAVKNIQRFERLVELDRVFLPDPPPTDKTIRT